MKREGKTDLKVWLYKFEGSVKEMAKEIKKNNYGDILKFKNWVDILIAGKFTVYSPWDEKGTVVRFDVVGNIDLFNPTDTIIRFNYDKYFPLKQKGGEINEL